MIPIFSASITNANLDFQSSIKRVLDRHWYVQGEEVKRFEHEFAEYVGVAQCVSLANGTDALELALRGVGVAVGDKVVCVANAGFYGSTAIHAIGAIPLYVDVDGEMHRKRPSLDVRIRKAGDGPRPDPAVTTSRPHNRQGCGGVPLDQ